MKRLSSTGYDLDLEASIQYAVVALLNEWDYSDIVAVVVKAFRTSNDNRKAVLRLELLPGNLRWRYMLIL
jgi:hypothetical protein